MEPIFDNAQLLKLISPDADVISRLKSQRNFAIGIGVVLIIVAGILCYKKIIDRREKDYTK